MLHSDRIPCTELPASSPIADAPHPSWCSPLHCDAGQHADTRHSSTPETWTPSEDDVDVSIALHRDDERAFDGTFLRHAHGLLLTLENTASVNEDGCSIRAEVLLGAADAEHLAAQLLDHAGRVRRATAGAAR